LKQDLFLCAALFIAQLPIVVVEFELQKLSSDISLVVELAFDLLGDALSDPHHPAHWRKRKREQTREKSHSLTSAELHE
jgi:hypothetical protein